MPMHLDKRNKILSILIESEVNRKFHITFDSLLIEVFSLASAVEKNLFLTMSTVKSPLTGEFEFDR